MKKLLIGLFALCLTSSIHAQFATGIRGSMNLGHIGGQKDFLKDLSVKNNIDSKYFKANALSVGTEMFIQYDFKYLGLEVDFGLNNRQGMIAEYESKNTYKKVIYTWKGYYDYTTYELSPLFRIIRRGNEANLILAAGPNFVFTKDTTRYGQNDSKQKTTTALQNTFNYGLRCNISLESPLTRHSLISMGASAIYDFKNAYQDDANYVFFNNNLGKRFSFHMFAGIGFQF